MRKIAFDKGKRGLALLLSLLMMFGMTTALAPTVSAEDPPISITPANTANGDITSLTIQPGSDESKRNFKWYAR
ncbi:MAG: hypothetical protein LBI36_07770, partial [Oscillospiraceae bacterium]|nr:hypothetical protein [Oscillospiraceae bacterium]